MIKKLICLIWGHKFMVKAYTGQQYEVINRLTGCPEIGNYYKWERQKFCLRCGADIKGEE